MELLRPEALDPNDPALLRPADLEPEDPLWLELPLPYSDAISFIYRLLLIEPVRLEALDDDVPAPCPELPLWLRLELPLPYSDAISFM